MIHLLLRLTLGHLRRHLWQAALAVAGIALGVAVVTAVDLATEGARRAMVLTLERVAGRATHTLTGPATGLDERLYATLRLSVGIRQSAPRVSGFGRVGGVTLELLGIDPLAEQAVGRGVGAAPDGDTLAALLTRPGAVLLPRARARSLGLQVGDAFSAQFGGRSARLHLAGVLADGAEGSGLMVADIATAQTLLDRLGRLTAIELILTPQQVTAVTRLLPPGHRLEPRGVSSAAIARLARGFTLNLAALSLLALVVGGFLIYNTMTFSVVQRRALFGRLRAVGATRGQLLGLVMAEAALLGGAGVVVGLPAGMLLGEGLIHLVTRTINDLYFVLTVRAVALESAALVRGLALGLGVSLIAAVIPARAAGRVTPQEAMTRSLQEQRSGSGRGWLAGAGVAAGAAGAALLVLSPGLPVSYLGLVFALIGFALLAPLLTAWALAGLGALLPRRAVIAALALRGLRAAPSRSAMAIAALAVAIAASVGMGVMVEGFRDSVARWLGWHLQADLYVSVPGHAERRASTPLTVETLARLTADSAITGFSSWRSVEVASDRGAVRLAIIGHDPRARAGYRLVGGAPLPWPALEQGGVLVSESFANRHGVGGGDALVIDSDRGAQRFPVVGVYTDYGSDRGVVLMLRPLYERWWRDRAISAVGLYLRDDADPDAVRERLLSRLAGAQEVVVRSNRALRQASLALFDRTFTVTRVLRYLAMAVAFVAVLSALLAMQLERARELAILRAVGLLPGQVWRLVLTQTAALGAIAGLLALPLGLGVGWVLARVIHRQSFGWSIDWQVDAAGLVTAVGLAVVAALLAAIYPAWRQLRVAAAEALREE